MSTLFALLAAGLVFVLIVYLGFIRGDGPVRGLLHLPVADGHNVRFAMIAAAVWLIVFALPLITTRAIAAPDAVGREAFPGVLNGYRRLWADVREEWRRDRNLVYFLVVSAVFRDGLAGVFAFGAVLGVGVYGISQGDILIFGVIASTVAALGALAGGRLDDRVGPKPVIVGSLAAMVAVGLTLMSLSGPHAFWICGLLLCLFVGPTQSASRTLLLRMTGEGKEGVAFGLYTTTGRAVAFLAPWMFFTFVDLFGTDRAGLGGICLVLAAGLAGMLRVRVSQAMS